MIRLKLERFFVKPIEKRLTAPSFSFWSILTYLNRKNPSKTAKNYTLKLEKPTLKVNKYINLNIKNEN